MSWIKENKFLFGYGVVTAIGVGALGYLLLGAKGAYDEAQDTYAQRAAELNRLQKLAIFPNQKNLDKLVEQQKSVNEEVKKLGDSLATQQLPIESISPEQFQDKLNATVRAVKVKAAGQNPPVKLLPDKPDKFFLGFDRYETAPPDKAAASVLGRELKAMEWLINTLIDKKIASLTALVREELPEEKGAKAEAKSEPDKKGGSKGGKEAASKKTINRHNITLTFLCEQQHFRDYLNAIVAYKNQYFIPRLVTVKNEKATGPQRGVVAATAPDPNIAAVPTDPAAPVAPTAPAASTISGAPTTEPVSQFIIGEERIEVTLLLEMLDFVEPSAPAK